MGCVNRSSKEFKNLAARHNVDDLSLELIVHKYWLETGNETLFPTDVYIQAQLGNGQYQEDGKSVRKLWEKRYSHPMEYQSLGEVQAAQKEAFKYFPKSAVYFYKNAKGSYMLSVKKPVAKVKHDKESFFMKLDSMESPGDIKTLDLGIKDDRPYGIETVQSLYNRFNNDRTAKNLADKVFKLAKDLNISFSFNDTLPGGIVGRYENNNTITYKKSFLESNMENDKKAPIILHELLHAVSSYALSDKMDANELSEPMQKFRVEMNSLYQDLKNNPILKGERGIVNVKEFVAELSNPVFRAKIKEIDNENKPKRTFWQRVLDAFKSLLNLHVTSSYYERSMKALDNALDAFDVDSYMRYNNIKAPLREGFNAKKWNYGTLGNKLKKEVSEYFDNKSDNTINNNDSRLENKNDIHYEQSIQRFRRSSESTTNIAKDDQYGMGKGSEGKATESKSLRARSHEAVIQFIRNLSDKQLSDELHLIEQEYDDYDLSNGIKEEESKRSSKAVPQDFTFNDGTVVKAPFMPNGQQIDALNAMSDFIKSRETSMTLSGYAGTGKTSLMEMIAKKCKKQGRPVMFCATTNKAAAVLNDRVSKAGFKATTLNKTFGINVEIDPSAKNYNARNLVNNLKEVDIMPGTTIIIDEASMINEENYRILNRIADENALKIIYVGDEAQLAPVNEEKISKVFRNGDGKVVRLTQVERTDDNAILKEATAIRNGEPLSGETSFNGKGEGVAYISPEHQDAINKVIGHYVKGLKKEPNHFRILAYTNKAVSDYNNQVRKLLGYDSPIPQVGEPMTGYTNWGYDWRLKSYRFINSESYKVLNTGKTKTVSTRLDDGTQVTMEAIPITLEDSLSNKDTFDFMDIKANPQNRQAAMVLANEKKRLWAKARQVYGRQAKAEIYAKINHIDSFLFVNDNIEDNDHNLLQAKTIDFGYALTIHKSQGSTFTNVLMDDVDVSKAAWGNDASKAMETVTLDETETKNNPNNAEITSTEDVDLGDLSDVTEAPKQNDQAANIKQQLEYVGVSRATDTVTIVSNHIKKEGSPLDPKKDIKEDTIKENGNRSSSNNNNNVSNGTVNLGTTRGFLGAIKDMIREEGARQLVEHLKSMGLNVLSRADMAKFFKEHPNMLVQMAKSFAGSQLTFAKNVKKPIGIENYLLSSAIMTQANTFENIREDLQDNIGSVAKRVIFFGNNAYLWSTENGYEFFVEQSLPINENNYNTLNDWIDTYGTDANTLGIIRNIQALRNEKARKRSYIESLRRRGVELRSATNNRFNGLQRLAISNSTGTDGNTVSNTEKQGNLEDVSFFIGKKARTKFEQSLMKARPDMGNTGIQSTLDFLHSLEDNKENTAYIKAAIRWVANRSITLPQDNVVARQAFDAARKHHVDIQKYSTLAELLKAPEMQPKTKEKQVVSPDEQKTFTNKRTVTTKGGRVFTVYDVENSEEGQRAVCKILASHYAYSPWCLSTFTSKGEPTESAKNYWHFYNAIPRKIAFENGKPVAFSSSEEPVRDKLMLGNVEVYKDSNGQYEIMPNREGNYPNNMDFESDYYQYNDEHWKYDITEKGLKHIREVKARSKDAWWDMEDREAKDFLDDTIANEVKSRESPIEGNVPVNEDFELPFYMTPQGEVYGFVDYDGNIYLDETNINAEHPIHEYTHLWDRVVAQKNPQLWNRGVELMKQTPLWNDVLNDNNYGKKWQGINGMTQEKLDQLIASEVHSKLTGEGGGALLEKIAKEKGKSGIITKLKQWILDVWKDLKATFSPWSKEDLDNLTLKDFNHMTVRDLAEGINPLKIKNTKESKEEEARTDSPTSQEAQSYTVQLPGYEYFNDLYEDSTVDAEWKIPYLKELDAQLSNANSGEENQNILDQMDNILQSTSKEEYLQQLSSSKVNKTKRKISEYEKLNKQLDNLLEGGDEDYEEFDAKLPASEVRHAAAQAMDYISDEITRLQKEEGLAEKLFPSLSTDLDFKTATRRQIVETVGINRLLDRAKALFDSEAVDYDDLNVSMQANLIFDNWDAIVKMGSDVFAFNEGFGITKDYNNGRFGTTDDSKMDYDNFNDYSNDPEIAAEEGEKDEQEKWQIDVKTVDVLNSMSALVRQGIHDCYLLDENGEKVMSKWLIPERVDPREAVNSILRWTQGALTLDAMIERLTEKQKQNPWLSQLITRLSDKSGKETDFQSQFFGVFEKHFQLYTIVLQEKGKYHSMAVNSHPALSDIMKSITSKYKIGEHTLFNGNKVNSNLLGSKEDGKNAKFSLHKALNELREITKTLDSGKALDDEMTKAATGNILEVCKALGFDEVTKDMVTDALNAENIKKETEYLGYIVKSLDAAQRAQDKGELKDYEPFGFKKKHSIDGSLKNFLTPITDRLEDTAVNAFYDSGKMYQSRVTPSFLSKLMNKFKLEGKKFEEFMTDSYASSEWYAFNKTDEFVKIEWRNEWLRLLANDETARKVFDHQVELSFNKHNYMRNMFDTEYTLSLITQYFGVSTNSSDSMVPAWFRVPMQSNKPSSDFIKFYSHRGLNYKRSIVRGLHDIFLQELSRIQTVRMRNLGKKDWGFIKNFDTNGRKFNFLPVFNAYLEDTPVNKVKRKLLHNGVEYDAKRLDELKQKENIWKEEIRKSKEWQEDYVSQKTDEDFLYEKGKDPVILQENERVKSYQLSLEEAEELRILEGRKEADGRRLSTEEDDRFASLLQKKLKGEEALTSDEEASFGNLVDKIIRQYMENRVQSILDNWEERGILDAAKSVQGIYPTELNDEDAASYVREQVENFLWNDALASKNILELTIGDIAFYKDTEDLQKRLAQLHAPGIRGRIDATDYEGNRVSDGKYRTFILKDFDTFKSNIIANISEVFDRKIAEADDSQKPQMIALKESLVGKDGKYTKINVTDAQGYSSPASYRKKAFIFGRWSRDAEKIYQRIKSGDYTLTDFETAFQPLKPFVYSMLDKNLGVDNAPIHNMKVPFQAKNAEYLLIMADAILQGEKLSRPNLLRAVYRVMEDSEKMNPTMGIDTVQFESAIKSGLQGQMDIAQFMEKEGGEEMAYDYMMNNIYKTVDGKLTKDYDTDTFVHETSYEDYCLQQEIPEHFKLHSQAHGSQIRMITPSDLDLYTTDENGNQVDNYYTWKEPDGTVKKMKADEFRKEYEQTIAENIEESINDLVTELHLDSADKKERNIALSEILQKEIVSSPRYGLDMMQACSVDENGEFRIPKGDPIQAKRIEQLINSIIKNRVNKQKIAGGPIVQVSNFGTSRQLHIRFNDRQGNLMPLEEEYNPSEHDGLSYKDYCKKNQGGIAYFEVFCPMWNDEIYEKFSNPDGTINIDAINAMDPEYLKMVSYRIPTEDKYSCAPMKVVGFMPRWAGDAIMLPYELTEIDDSDFDIDKRYVMRKDIPVKTKRRGEIETELFKRAFESYKKAHGGKTANEKIGEQVRMFMDNPQKMKNADSLMKWLYKQYQSIAYYTEAPTSGRQYRDNKIIDMTYAVLTNERTADKILNPGGFDAPKKMGYMVAAYKNPSNNVKWEDLEKMSIQELKDLSYTDKDLTFADTQVQFYKQNSAAASLIGVFAVNKVAHATLESNGINLCISDICGDTPISIAGTTFGEEVAVKAKDRDGNDITIKKRMQVIDAKYDSQGTLIGKTLGSLVSASADAVKDPILNLMNVNMTTAGMLNTMLRFGMPFNDAALFLSQDIIERLLSQFNRENLSNYVTLDSLIDKWLDSYRTKENLQDNSIINSEPLTKDELVEGLTSDEHEKIDYKVLLAYKKLKALTDAMRKPTYATRFNSISSAVGPLIIDNLIMERKMEDFRQGTMPGDTPFFSYDDNFNEWIPVDIDDIFTDHPVLQQFSKTVDIAKSLFSDMPTGSNGFRSLIRKLPKEISDKMYGDKKLLDDFSNFYQSYLLIQSGVVNPGELRETVTKFPKEFIEKGYKEEYKGNAFIDAIRLNVSKSGTPFLQINLTGMDEPAKEKLRYAWVDLHKDNPELSKKLFDYSFFRAGIGFSPKTFMSLVPLYVKERLKNGNATYVDTYRNFPTIVPELVIDQFIRNNWENTKLVPWRGDKNTKYNVDIKHDRLTVYREEDKKDVENLTYMKTNQNKVAYLWHNVGKDTNGDIVFERIKPLGNNGEYLEMDVNKIVNPLSETLKTEESNEASDLQTPSPQESNAEEVSNTSVISQTEQAKKLDEIVDLIQKQVPRFSKEKATDKFNEIKDGNVRVYKKFLQNVFKQKGLELNEEEAINEFKKYC